MCPASRRSSFPAPQPAVLQHPLACCLTTPWLFVIDQGAAFVLIRKWLRQTGDTPLPFCAAVKDKLQRNMLSVVPAGNSAGPITGLLFMGAAPCTSHAAACPC